VQRILAEQPLHSEKVKYYLERRDPNFEAKMREILLVYQAVALQNQPDEVFNCVSSVSNLEVRLSICAGVYSGFERLGRC
jgi:hypothetical protein